MDFPPSITVPVNPSPPHYLSKDTGRISGGPTSLKSPPRSMGSVLVYNKELDRNLDEVCELRNHYNYLKHQTKGLESMVNELQMKCQELNITEEDFDGKEEKRTGAKADGEGTESNSHIAQLEESLFHSDRKTSMLRHILARTKNKRRDLVTKLEVYKKKYASTHAETDRVASVTRELENALKNAKNDLRKTMMDHKRQKERHAHELGEMTAMLEERRRLSEEREAVNIRRKEIIAQAQGDLDEEGEERLKTELITAKLKKVRLHAKESEIDSKISLFEESYQKIKQSTGINDINEILEKLSSQKETSDNIEAMTREAEKKIAALNIELSTSKLLLKDMQLSGLGNIGKQRQEIVEYETELDHLSALVKSSTAKVSFVTGILDKTVRGAKYIAMKLRDMSQDPISVDDISEGNLVATIAHFENSIAQISAGLSPAFKTIPLSSMPLRQIVYVSPIPTSPVAGDIPMLDKNMGGGGEEGEVEEDTQTWRTNIKKEVGEIMNAVKSRKKKLTKKQTARSGIFGPELTDEERTQIDAEVLSVIRKKLKSRDRKDKDEIVSTVPLHIHGVKSNDATGKGSIKESARKQVVRKLSKGRA